MIRKYQKLFRNNEDDSQFWPSFTDLLTTILICFILFFIFSMFIYTSQIKAVQKGLNDYKQTIEQIMGVRTSIVEALKKEFNDSKLKVNIDEETGAIVFSGNILFEYGKDTLRPEFKQNLNQVIPKYINVLLSEEFQPHIAEIIIEGHTDKEGGYLSNLELSQDRALSVAEYILSDKFTGIKDKKELEKKISVNGRSYSAWKPDEEGEYDADKSRRVEFKFRLKDNEILDATKHLLDKME
jgi:outer membrane protein OmpA-like peptidoglycan-associated protein